MNRKLPAFTILEVLISLIVMGIIIGLTYSIYSLMSKQLRTYEDDSVSILEYNLFNTTLKHDLNNAQDVVAFMGGFTLKNYQTDDVTYQVRNSKILRTIHTKSDTLQVQVIHYEIDEQENSTRIQFKLKVLNDSLSTYYIKNRSISDAINRHYLNED